MKPFPHRRGAQDRILREVALPDADYQSAIRQVANLRYGRGRPMPRAIDRLKLVSIFLGPEDFCHAPWVRGTFTKNLSPTTPVIFSFL